MREEIPPELNPGTMSLIAHLSELRIRLIRCVAVLLICILGAYVFRKDILSLIRKPLDEPLKKYTSIDLIKEEPKEKAAPIPIQDLYNCYCTPVAKIKETVPKIDPSEKNRIISSLAAEKDKSKSTANKSLLNSDLTSDNKIKQKVSSEQITTKKEQKTELAERIFPFLKDKFKQFLGLPPESIGLKRKTETQINSGNNLTGQLSEKVNLNCTCKISVATEKSSSIQKPNSTMVFLGLTEVFFSQMKVAFFAGLFLAFPYLIIELWGFVAPALRIAEKRVFCFFAAFTLIFFIGGALFGFFVVFPFGFDFFLSLTEPGELMPSLSIGQYLDFALKLLFAFGSIFELPLVILILSRLGIVTPEFMIKNSKYAILIIFIASAILTPPDPFTMLLMAAPLSILYVISIGVSFMAVNRAKAAERAGTRR